MPCAPHATYRVCDALHHVSRAERICDDDGGEWRPPVARLGNLDDGGESTTFLLSIAQHMFRARQAQGAGEEEGCNDEERLLTSLLLGDLPPLLVGEMPRCPSAPLEYGLSDALQKYLETNVRDVTLIGTGIADSPIPDTRRVISFPVAIFVVRIDSNTPCDILRALQSPPLCFDDDCYTHTHCLVAFAGGVPIAKLATDAFLRGSSSRLEAACHSPPKLGIESARQLFLESVASGDWGGDVSDNVAELVVVPGEVALFNVRQPCDPSERLAIMDLLSAKFEDHFNGFDCRADYIAHSRNTICKALSESISFTATVFSCERIPPTLGEDANDNDLRAANDIPCALAAMSEFHHTTITLLALCIIGCMGARIPECVSARLIQHVTSVTPLTTPVRSPRHSCAPTLGQIIDCMCIGAVTVTPIEYGRRTDTMKPIGALGRVRPLPPLGGAVGQIDDAMWPQAPHDPDCKVVFFELAGGGPVDVAPPFDAASLQTIRMPGSSVLLSCSDGDRLVWHAVDDTIRRVWSGDAIVVATRATGSHVQYCVVAKDKGTAADTPSTEPCADKVPMDEMLRSMKATLDAQHSLVENINSVLVDRETLGARSRETTESSKSRKLPRLLQECMKEVDDLPELRPFKDRTTTDETMRLLRLFVRTHQ